VIMARFKCGRVDFLLSRGAAGSAGRTSWSSKPERDDYISFVGFVVYYVHYVNPFAELTASNDVSPQRPLEASPDMGTHPVLLLGGYSYGAIVTSQLPPINEILELFRSPAAGTDAAQIRLRAEHLAVQQNEVLSGARAALLERRARSPGSMRLRVGGDEDGGSPKKSSDTGGRRSFSFDADDKFRRGVHDLFVRHKSSRAGRSSFRSTKNHHNDTPIDGNLPSVADLAAVRSAYLLVSPPHGIVKHLATMSLWTSSKLRTDGNIIEQAAENKLVHNPTLSVFGGRDAWVGASKLRAWASDLATRQGSLFQGHEVATAGHFWVEEGVMYELQSRVSEFAGALIAES
jgi:hypothetical protein